MLSIKHVSKSFHDHVILHNISLDIAKGSTVIFLGGSGVGKSTLLRILSDLETIDSGSITFDGKPLHDNRKNHVGMVFQQFNLFNHLTAIENITLSLIKAHNVTPQDAQKQALELLEQYDLLDKKDKYPSQLSGGQKQRLALARALALKPEIICLDEPTSALDPLLTNYVAQIITGLAQQQYTVVIATHDITLLDALDATIYLMHEGRIVEHAHTKEFKTHKKQFPRLAAFVAGVASTDYEDTVKE